MTQHTINLPDDTAFRLKAASERTGKTADDHILEAIEQHLEEIEDLQEAERIVTSIQRGETKTSSLDEVSRRLGLDD